MADLPERSKNTVMAQLTGEQTVPGKPGPHCPAGAAPRGWEFKEDKLKVLAELTKLRQICCDPRHHTTRITRRGAPSSIRAWSSCAAHSTAHRILLFSQFTGMLDIIGKRYKGGTSPSLSSPGASSKESAPRWSRSSKRARFRL